MFIFTKSSYKETNIQPESSFWSDLSLANVNVDLCLIILSIYSIPYTCNSSIYEHLLHVYQVYRIQTFFARKKIENKIAAKMSMKTHYVCLVLLLSSSAVC